MDDNNIQYVQHSTCQCRCPCHYQKNTDNISPPPPPPPQQQPSRMAQITFSETIQINDSEPDQMGSYNPFRVKAAAPAAAAFSKSFLHVKNIVKNMTARWESLTEPGDDDDSEPKRRSFDAQCAGPACANPENLHLNWKRVSVDRGDQKQYQWKRNSDVPENIEQHQYSLEPLENSRNLSMHNNVPDYLTPQNLQTFQSQTPTLHAVENSFQQEDSPNFVDTVVSKHHSSHLTKPENMPSLYSTSSGSLHLNNPEVLSFHSSNADQQICSLPSTNAMQIHSVHSTNPMMEPEDDERSQQMDDDLDKIIFENTFKWEEEEMKPPPPPRAVQSEVKNIRKSFEEDVDEIVQKVNRTSIDAYSYRRHSADNTSAMSGLHHWLNEMPFADEPQISQARSNHSFEKLDNMDGKSNNVGFMSASPTSRSKAAIRKDVTTNDDNDARADIFSSSAAHTQPTRSQMNGTIHPSFHKEEGDNDDNLLSVKAVATTLSLDWENPQNFSLRRKSYDDYPAVSFGSPTATGSRAELEGSKRRLSAPTNITSQQCQLSRNFIRENHDDGVVQKSIVGVDKSIQSVVPQSNFKSDATIQTSHAGFRNETVPSADGNFSCVSCSVRGKQSDMKKELHDDNTCNIKSEEKTLSMNSIKSRSESSQTNPKVEVNYAVSKLEMNPSPVGSSDQLVKHNYGEEYHADTLSRSMKTIKSNKSASPKISTQKKEDDSLNKRNDDDDDQTPLEEIARFATGTLEANEEVYNTYMALISVQDGRKSCHANNHGKEVSRRKFRHDRNANITVAKDCVRARPMPPSHSSEEKETFLNNLSKEYDQVVATPSQLLVEPICHSVSVSNTCVKMQKGNERNISSHHKKWHLSAPMTSVTTIPGTQIQSSSGKEKGSKHQSKMGMQRSKREFYKCHKCHKIVSSGEAAFNSTGGIDIAWHHDCFRCSNPSCHKNLSQVDHSFFDEEPYCLEHLSSVANIPKCSKCHQLIFDSTYTSTAGNSYHRQHFTCHLCKKPLVDTKYVFVGNKHPYCLHCHEKHFPKQCRTCLGRISPQEPYVQGGDVFWHSNSACLHCSSCDGSLVGRSLFFRRGSHLYCNRYCALRKM